MILGFEARFPRAGMKERKESHSNHRDDNIYAKYCIIHLTHGTVAQYWIRPHLSYFSRVSA